MGTVPHPLGPAKLSLVTASEEKDCLGDLPPAKHQTKAHTAERASNGFPCTALGSAASYACDLKHADTQRLEDGNLPPRLSTHAAEGHQAGVEPAPVAVACSAGCEPDMMPAPQSSQQFMQSGQMKVNALMQVEDSAVKAQRAEDQLVLQVSQCSSPSSSVGSNESCPTSQASLLQREEKGGKAEEASAQPASPAIGMTSDPGRDPQEAVEAKSRTAGTEQLHPADQTETEQSSQSPAQLSHEEAHPVHDASVEPGILGPAHLSKFRETGTMTIQSECSALTQEAASRTWRDAEVQAVATVESKSASTSPSILAAFLKGNPPPEEKEELHVIYQGSGGLSQSKLADSFSSQQKSPCSPGIVLKSTIDMAVAATVQSQPDGLPGILPHVVSPASADNAEPALPLSSAAATSQGMPVDTAEGMDAASGSKGNAALPADAAALPKPVPAQQLAIRPHHQPGAGKENTASAAGTENKVQCLVHDAGSSQLPSLCHTPDETKQNVVLGSSEQYQGPNKVEVIPQSVAKPKEENLMVLDAQGAVKTRSEPISRKAHTGDAAGGEEQSGGQGEARQAVEEVGTTAVPGCSSRHASPHPEASAAPQQQGLQAKEAKPEIHATTLPSSAQALPNRGESKKQPTPAMEAKVQVKQSKHIRDVVWDEQGMTWEVYGASLDPESLGIAIQNHLQRQIREHEKLIQAQNSQNRKSISSDTSSNKKLKGRQHNVFQSMLQNFRRPNCCVRPAPSSVLD
ncbi:G protein-regulated inducer of neurite outgrowth 3 [Numida meleagris]|uniref:G protein-regulated inducer of neurite outgrowth 3 n=1 Tax=Numida meleagris TaxID=8996 RepID=UPI000B3E1C62|nr:G protein-regulated inducer of neurite outgrowth 3 [Numida meleagris]XP_021250919.1 G protein-regulated inducer of neurite outgrowth 3 [Numida meleagris]XP_021250920.1 G protein-regulated inducer of neurite outgrowth 3 [Numida meleagris]XP_021250921.1 G protein-regulated inducer of neurite outgrowth 3 [Numida meleagris]XP_021250923.1 G protein-regulated inducer of neurite outgrowth 3 [Numida meleagris]XP_021250924.1 G protein-regulated inducer of neurite outgrowth 3 [Numida meleagris]XP_02